MMCQRIGLPPMSTIGFGRNSVSSRIRVPCPPQRMTTFTRPVSALAGYHLRMVRLCIKDGRRDADEEVMANGFWLDRPVLVTGATGLLGSWLSRELLARGARVIVIVRDELPDAQLVTSGDLARCVRVRGDVEDGRLLERVLVEHEVDAVFHLAAQTIVEHAVPRPARHVPRERRRHLGAARRLPPLRPAGADPGRVVGQGLRDAAGAALHRGPAARGPPSLRRLEELRRPDRAPRTRRRTTCRSRSRAAGTCSAAAISTSRASCPGRSATRCAASARCCGATARRCATTCTWTTPSTRTSRSPSASTSRTCAARPGTSAASSRRACSR